METAQKEAEAAIQLKLQKEQEEIDQQQNLQREKQNAEIYKD